MANIMIEINDFAKRFKLRFIAEVHGISLREIKISMRQYEYGGRIVIDYYIVMKNGRKKWKFFAKGKGKKKGGIIPGDFIPVPDDEDIDLEDIKDEDFYPMIEILTKGCQGGKTVTIVARCILSSLDKRFFIVVVPSIIGLSEQNSGRIEKGIDPAFIDSVNVDNAKKEILKGSPKHFTSGQIGRWDTGCKKEENGKLSGDISKDIKKIREGKIKGLVVLNNKAGISKLIVLLSYLKDKKVDIIIDEVHTFLDIGPLSRTFERRYKSFEETCNEDFPDENDAISYKNVDFDINGRKMWILRKFIERQGGISITGLTATISYLVQNNQIKNLGLEFPVIMLDTPDCYIGYKNCVKKIFKGDYTDCFNEIIKEDKENENGTTVMFHSGNRQETHYTACEDWINCCKENGVPPEKIGSMTDNSEGYTHYDSNNKIIKKLKKGGKITEPWQAVYEFKKVTPFMGIFGNNCMGMGNTYQKCTPKINCPINHMVTKDMDKCLNKDLTKKIQQYGRICTNDTSKKNNKRTIWFSSVKEQKKFEHGFKLDKHLQLKSKEVSLAALDFKTENKIVKKGNFDLDGKEIKSIHRGPNDLDTPDEIESKFQRWHKTRSQSKIAKMMRKLKVDKLYTRQEFLDIADSVNFKKDNVITNMSRSVRIQGGFGNIIEVLGNNIRIRPEIKELYIKYFGK
jgi:hypothetical protein